MASETVERIAAKLKAPPQLRNAAVWHQAEVDGDGLILVA